MKKFYVIIYDFSCWSRTHPHAMTLSEAQAFAKNYANSNVIHEMWLDCLSEWPAPGYLL